MSEHKERRWGSGCLFGFLTLCCFFVGLIFALAMLGGDVSSELSVSERHLSGALEGEGVAVIEVSGVMMRGGDGFSDEGITRPLLKMLERARVDHEVKGVLLQINTPGGSVTDADLIYRSIKRLREQGKVVIVHMDDTCASGGYYISLAADEVWALPTTITGSIGVIVSGLNFSDLLSKYGVRDVTITSGANKAILSPTSPVDEAHVALLQSIVDAMYARFLALLMEGRGLEEGPARALADGRIFVSEEALKHKLIDRVGYFDESLSSLKERLKLPENARVKRYSVPRSFWSALGGALQPALDARVTHALSAHSGQRALYLYAPQGLTAFLLRGAL